ncbi:MAG: MFS transporter [Anaerolineales bacterium]|nr:MFS transporter [Anaerolineales bacterium]
MNNKRLFSIILVVFIDLLGFSLILPLLPYYAETFSANQTTTGILIASYAVMQLIGAPILGRLSDRFGRRPVLLLSVFGTFLGFLLLGFANSLWMLFASRILDGLTGGNLSVAQAYISDVTDEKSRSKGLGMIGAAFGLGFIIGPVTGGLLSQWGYAVPAFAAAAISFINLILIYAWLPESLTEEKRSQMTEKRPAVTFECVDRCLPTPVHRLDSHHPFLFWVGLRNLPNHLLVVCAGKIQSHRTRHRLCIDLRWRALCHRTRLSCWPSYQPLP